MYRTKKKRSIVNQLLTPVIWIWLGVLIVGLTICGYYFYKETKRTSVQYAALALEKAGSQVESFIHKHIDIAMHLEQQVSGNVNGRYYVERDRDDVITFLKEELHNYDQVYGVFAIYEPNCFDGRDDFYRNHRLHDKTGEFKVWITKEGNKVIEDALTLDYYQIPKKTNQVYITSPYLYEVNDEKVLFVTITVPIVENGVFKGAVGCDIMVDRIQNYCAKINLWDGKGSIAVVDSKGKYVAHTHEPEKITENIADYSPDVQKRLEHLRNGTEDIWRHKGDSYITAGINLLEHLDKWQLRIKIKTWEVYRYLYNTLMIIMLTLTVLISVALVFLIRFVKRKVKPLNQLSIISEAMAKGDLTQKIDVKSNNEIGVLAKSFKAMVENLRTFISEMQNHSIGITDACSQLQSNAEMLSNTSTEQASVTEEISSNTEEMNATVVMTKDHSIEVADKTDETMQEMLRLQKGAKRATSAMLDIMHIVQAIEDVARIVKILSLNAAVEAARAGKHGKGFAVVAREIQNLSEDIGKLSEKITMKTEASNDAAIKASEIVDDLSPKLQNLMEKIKTIQVNTEEQASGINQIANGTHQMNNGVQTIAASAEEQASSIEELHKQAESLKELTVKYKI